MGLQGLKLPALAALAAAFACAPPAAAGDFGRPPVKWLKGEGNFTRAHRSPRTIDCIVVHVTEGAFWGSVDWLRNHHAHASAHYVVGRDGRIVQLVHQSDIAWHAGNWRVNAESVGIEHEGMTYDAAGFTAAEYDASARLAADIARRALMPIDRKHIIGHAEVPAPGRPGVYGGSGAHTDPGPHWNWARYLRLVRRYALLAQPLRVATSTLHRGERVKGIVPWRVKTSTNVRRVDFVVDGRVLWQDRRRPFVFARGKGLNTVNLDNGRRVLELRAYGPGGRVARAATPVVVWNHRFALTTAGARPWTRAPRVVKLRARVWAAKAEAVVFRVDGRRVRVDRRAPYVFQWPTSRSKPGKHLLEVVARSIDGRIARKRIPLVVAPKPKAKLTVLGQSLAEGQVLDGFVVWRADVSRAADRVEFWIDGALRGTDLQRPFTLGWDVSTEAAGPHQVEVRAFRGPRTASQRREVLVAAPLTAAAP